MITTNGPLLADGVTAFDGSDGADQPAPISAFTVNVNAVPVDKPVTGPATRSPTNQ